jgi:hypothetical protein
MELETRKNIKINSQFSVIVQIVKEKDCTIILTKLK